MTAGYYIDILIFMTVKLYRTLLSLFFPRTCASCGCIIRLAGPLCRKCIRNLETFPLSGNTSVNIYKRYHIFKYCDTLRKVVHLYKYRHHKYISLFLGKHLNTFVQFYDILYKNKIDLICPIPIHRQRHRERGYNQSLLIAEHISCKHGIVCRELIKAVKNRKTQTAMNARQRALNTLDCFSAIDDVTGKNIMLIDDVCTTGATINECAKILKTSGADKIIVLTAAAA